MIFLYSIFYVRFWYPDLRNSAIPDRGIVKEICKSKRLYRISYFVLVAGYKMVSQFLSKAYGLFCARSI